MILFRSWRASHERSYFFTNYFSKFRRFLNPKEEHTVKTIAFAGSEARNSGLFYLSTGCVRGFTVKHGGSGSCRGAKTAAVARPFINTRSCCWNKLFVLCLFFFGGGGEGVRFIPNGLQRTTFFLKQAHTKGYKPPSMLLASCLYFRLDANTFSKGIVASQSVVFFLRLSQQKFRARNEGSSNIAVAIAFFSRQTWKMPFQGIVPRDCFKDLLYLHGRYGPFHSVQAWTLSG